MVVWKEFVTQPDNAKGWDMIVEGLVGMNPYQSLGWGEMKAAAGWGVLRFAAYDQNQQVQAAAQVLYKRLAPRVFIFWCPGGPVGEPEFFKDELIKLLTEKTRAKVWFMRISVLQARTPDGVVHLLAHGWKQALYRINSGLSMLLPLTPGSPEKILSGSSGNWRHNYKRGLKQNIHVQEWKDPNPSQIFDIYREMQTYKDLKEQIPLNQIKSMLDQFKENLIVFKGTDASDHILALRGYLRFGDKAWDLFAATKPEARKSYASYAILGHLLSHAAINGCQSYDLSGIDPQHNTGVYFFKKGTGAAPVEFLGEWDQFSHWLFALGVNFALRFRNNI